MTRHLLPVLQAALGVLVLGLGTACRQPSGFGPGALEGMGGLGTALPGTLRFAYPDSAEDGSGAGYRVEVYHGGRQGRYLGALDPGQRAAVTAAYGSYSLYFRYTGVPGTPERWIDPGDRVVTLNARAPEQEVAVPVWFDRALDTAACLQVVNDGASTLALRSLDPGLTEVAALAVLPPGTRTEGLSDLAPGTRSVFFLPAASPTRYRLVTHRLPDLAAGPQVVFDAVPGFPFPFVLTFPADPAASLVKVTNATESPLTLHRTDTLGYLGRRLGPGETALVPVPPGGVTALSPATDAQALWTPGSGDWTVAALGPRVPLVAGGRPSRVLTLDLGAAGSVYNRLPGSPEPPVPLEIEYRDVSGQWRPWTRLAGPFPLAVRTLSLTWGRNPEAFHPGFRVRFVLASRPGSWERYDLTRVRLVQGSRVLVDEGFAGDRPAPPAWETSGTLAWGFHSGYYTRTAGFSGDQDAVLASGTWNTLP